MQGCEAGLWRSRKSCRKSIMWFTFEHDARCFSWWCSTDNWLQDTPPNPQHGCHRWGSSSFRIQTVILPNRLLMRIQNDNDLATTYFNHSFINHSFIHFVEIKSRTELYSSSKLDWNSEFNSVFFRNSVVNSSAIYWRKAELELLFNSSLNFFELSSKSIHREWSAPF